MQAQIGPSGADQILTSVYDARTNALRTEGNGGSGGGTVSSVGLAMPGEFTVSGSPISTSGTISVGWSQPVSISHGGTGQSTAAAAFNALAPATSAGGLIYGTGSNSYGNLSLGPAGECLQSNGSTLTWAACGGGSFAAGGDLSGTASSQTVIGLEGRPVSSLAPTTGQALEWNGTAWAPASLSGFGTVTSVGLSLPSIFNITSSPVTSSGVLTATLSSQAANTFFAGPASGAAGTPVFRALTLADLPSLSFSNLTGAASLSQLPSSLAQFAGTVITGHCAQWSATGVLSDAGAACGSGSGSPVTIETNGTNNASQAALNLVSGAGISLTNTSGGNVTIAATGGGALPGYWINNSTSGSLIVLPNSGQDATPLMIGPSPTAVRPGSDLFDVYTGYLTAPASFGGASVASGGSIPTGDYVSVCVTLQSVAGGETPCSPGTTTSSATSTGNQSVNVTAPSFQQWATFWRIYACTTTSSSGCTNYTYQAESSNFITQQGVVVNLTSISTGGAAPPTANTALAGLAFGIAANGTLNFGNSYSLSLGSNNQPDASFVRQYGGIGAMAYDQYFSPALQPPLAPAFTVQTGGSGTISSSQGSITVGYTLVNGPSVNWSDGAGNYPETPLGQTTVIPSSAFSGCSSNCYISFTPPSATSYAGAYNLYVQNGSNWYLANSTPQPIGSALTLNSIPTGAGTQTAPASNTTGGQYQTSISAAPGANGLACVNSGVPGFDCAPGTFIATNPMTEPGDLIVGGGQIGSEGVVAPQVLHAGAAGQVLTSNGPGNAPSWQAGGGGGSSSWSSLGGASANLTLNNAAFSTTFDQTSAASWTWANTTASTSATVTQNAPVLNLSGTAWNTSSSTSTTLTGSIEYQTNSGPSPWGNLILTPNGGNIFFFGSSGSAAGAIYFQGCGTSSCDAIAENDSGGAARFQVSGSGMVQGANYTFNNSGGTINTGLPGNTDLAGRVSISAATSSSATFPTAYSAPPVCTITPTSNPGSLSWWVTTSATAVTANLSASGTVTFNYICVGAPN